MKKRFKAIGTGTQEDPFRINLPTYTMIPGTEKMGGPEKRQLISAEIEFPDDEADEKGYPSLTKIRKKYKGNPKWDREDVQLPEEEK